MMEKAITAMIKIPGYLHQRVESTTKSNKGKKDKTAPQCIGTTHEKMFLC